MSNMHKLLHEIHEKLTEFIKEERVVGSEKALKDHFAAYIALMAEKVNETHLQARVIKHHDAYGATVILRRDGEEKYSWANWHLADPVVKTDSPHSHGLVANPDADGYTWYLNHNGKKIPLEPKEGLMISFRFYQDYGAD